MFKFLKSLKQSKPIIRKPITTDSIQHLSLYYFPSCPFCRIVLKQINRMELDIELRNIHQDAGFKKELIAGGGKKTVPCLRIDSDHKSPIWMYESMDIVAFLQKTYGGI